MSVLVEARHPEWRQFTLNRPDRLNALNGELKEALLSHLADAASDETCRAVLLTGTGRGFCAGEDLAARQERPDAPRFGSSLKDFYNPCALAIRKMAKPVVCAVNGVAAGAGANLALACDIVLAAKSAQFIQAFTNIGLVPDTGGTWFLPRVVGDARARALILLGESITSQQAEEYGMIWRVVDDEILLDQARDLTVRLAQRPTQALSSAKSLLDDAFVRSLTDQLLAEADAQDRLGHTVDYAEGVAAFLEKRAAHFKGL